MKKLISTISAFALCASIIPGTVMAANGADYSTDFSDFVNGAAGFSGWTFNGEATPWFLSSTFCEDAATSAIADTDSGNANLKLVPSGGNLAGAIYNAGISDGVYKVSFKVKKSDLAAMRVMVTDTNNLSNVQALYITASENVVGTDGKAISKNQKGDTVQVTVDTWSDIDFIINENTKKILRFVDGRGVQSIDTSKLVNIDRILICASDGDVWIDDFSVTKLTDETEYSEPTAAADDLLNTNFTQYINHAFNTNNANNNDNLTLGNAAWRGGAYTVLTDRGVSMKLTSTSYTGNNDLYFDFPTGISTGVGVYTTEVYIKPVTTAGVTDVAAMKITLSGTATKELTTDTSGKVTAFAATKDKNGNNLTLNMDEWNKIELVNDLNNDVVYAFVNGYGCGSIINGSTAFTGVNVIASNNNACDVYVDDLRVYTDDASLYGTPDKTGYIENENFTAAAAKVSNAGSSTVMDFNNFKFGNAAWRGSVHATKTDKGISLCMGDPTGNTLTGNKWNDVTWTSTEALADTDGKYVIEFDEYYGDARTCKMIIDLNSSTSGQKTEFAVSDDGGIVGGNGKANFISGQWNHAKITVDLTAKTAVFNINGTDVKPVSGIANTDIKSLYIKTDKSGGGNHGDITIDNFTVQKILTPTEPTFTSNITKFSNKVSDTDKATGFLAEVTADIEGTIERLNWTVSKGENQMSKPVTGLNVTLAKGSAAYFGLIVENLYDDPDDASDDVTCTIEIN